MRNFDFNAAKKQAEREGLVGNSDIFKVAEGPNKIRLMSECLRHPGTFKGQPNFKWLAYVLDRKDGLIKPYFMPHSIFKAIGALQANEEYAFSDMPMPYDITINADGAGTKEVKYSVTPARQNTPVTPAEMNELDKKKPLKELQAIFREKEAQRDNGGNGPEAHEPSASFDPDDLPF